MRGANAVEGGRHGTFVFSRTGDLSQPLDVAFTLHGTATEGDDYEPLPRSVSFDAGESTATVEVVAIDDKIKEDLERVRVRIEDGIGYLVGADRAANVAIQDKNVPTLVIRDANGNDLAADGSLKVAKWENAFEVVKVGGEEVVQLKPPSGGDANTDFLDRDPDRFTVWVYDLKTWKKNKNEFIEAKISTANVAGRKAYNDDPTAISLTRTTEEGWFKSDSQILVSNEADDVYEDTERIGQDDRGPDDAMKYTKDKLRYRLSDRTHRIALGGTVKVTYKGAEDVAATVKVDKVVKLNINIMNITAGGAASVKEKQVQKDLNSAREAFAQIGIDISFSIHDSDPPKGVDLSDGLGTKDRVTSDEEIALLRHKNIRTDNESDIEVYYITRFNRNIEGASYFGEASVKLGIQDSIVMTAKTRAHTLAHEIFHILSNRSENGGHYPYDNDKKSKLDTVNLMIGKEDPGNDVLIFEARRLTSAQEQDARNNRKDLLHESE